VQRGRLVCKGNRHDTFRLLFSLHGRPRLTFDEQATARSKPGQMRKAACTDSRFLNRPDRRFRRMMFGGAVMIDWARVDELRSEIGPDGLREVFALFQQEVTEVLDRHQVQPKALHLLHDLHFLKGSALNVGFRQMGALCCTSESLAAEGRADQTDFAAILKCYGQSCAALADRLACL